MIVTNSKTSIKRKKTTRKICSTRLKTLSIKLVSVANIVAIVLLFLIGNVDKLQPIAHPWLANFGLGFPIVLAINVLFIIFWVIARPKRVLATFIRT